MLKLEILFNECISTSNSLKYGDIYLMKLFLDKASANSVTIKAGQFINIALPNLYLRRPISIANIHNSKDGMIIDIIYRVVGQGTLAMRELKVGDTLDTLLPLGKGFNIEKIKSAQDKGLEIVLLGGGVGIPPIYFLSNTLKEQGINHKVALGFRSLDDSYYIEEFKDFLDDNSLYIFTEDGSLGEQGFVTKILDSENIYSLSCGPLPMLKAIHNQSSDGQYSFEARMGCGFGACMGCSQRTKNGYKRVCKEGPIFYHDEILWEGL